MPNTTPDAPKRLFIPRPTRATGDTFIGALIEDLEADSAQRTADRAARAAQAATVTMSDGAARRVYPKQGAALEELQGFDAQLGRFAAAVTEGVAQTSGAPLGAASGPSLLAARAWVWIITTPGNGLPYDVGADVDPPEWTAAVTPDDLAALALAWSEEQAGAAYGRAFRARLAQLTADGVPAPAIYLFATEAQRLGVRIHVKAAG